MALLKIGVVIAILSVLTIAASLFLLAWVDDVMIAGKVLLTGLGGCLLSFPALGIGAWHADNKNND